MTARDFIKETASKSEAARKLGINRDTLRKYEQDIFGYNHFIKKVDGVYVLFARLGG